MSGAANASYRGLTHLCSDPDCHVPGFVATLAQRDRPRTRDGYMQCPCEAFDLDVTGPEETEDWCRCGHQRDAHDGHCQGVVLAASPGEET